MSVWDRDWRVGFDIVADCSSSQVVWLTLVSADISCVLEPSSSSCNVILLGFVCPVGCQDNASEIMPGMWMMVNLNLRVFSLRFRIRVLWMSARDLSPKILSRGL